MPKYGYAGEILRVDLSQRQTTRLPTDGYAERFLGGRGIAAKIYWDETSSETRALSPENCLVFITGPVAGFTRFAGCRWQICGKSAEMTPEAFSYANLGGSWGAWLKYAGFDGIAVVGKSEQPVYLFIENGRAEIHDARSLWGKTTFETQELLQARHGESTHTLEIGPAAENLVSFASILATDNASGVSGLGAVMGYKNLKAIAVKADEKRKPQAADPEGLEELAKLVFQLRTKNYENYGHETPSAGKLFACYGCISGCDRAMYQLEGRRFKSFCQASAVYIGPAMKYYGQKPETGEVARMATRLCDAYGLDTSVLAPMMEWLLKCYEAGILTDGDAGIPLSKMGSAEFIETLVKKIALREGFGDVLAQGVWKAAKIVGKGAENHLNFGVAKTGETGDYDPRLILANTMTYATEPRRAIQLLHATSLPLKRWVNWTEGCWKDALLSTEVLRNVAENFWGSLEALDFSTIAGKALAAKQIQDYGYAKESLILCDLSWPIYPVNPPDKTIGPGTIESRIVTAITGRQTDEKGLLSMGERIFNLQRAVLMRQGWGGRSGDNLMGYLFKEPIEWTFFDPQLIVPGKDGQPISRKGAVMNRSDFEQIKDEYYQLRGWDIESGRQKKSKMKEAGLEDISRELEKLGLVSE